MDLKINKLPVPTWNWLKVNDYQVAIPEEINEASYRINTKDVNLQSVQSFADVSLEGIEIGAGNEFKSISDKNSAKVCAVNVNKDTVVKEPIRIDFDYSKEENAFSKFAIKLENKSELTVIINFKGNPSFGGNDIRFSVAEDAHLTVVEIFDFEDNSNFIDSIGGSLEKIGGLKLMQLNRGLGNVALSCYTDLVGDKSTLDIDTGYLVRGNDRLDINYVAKHRGVSTDSKIKASGVLRDNATKTFRGTIDFIKGAKHATGDEREDVLLMNEGVHNNTVPLILCAEEDVEGGHGATIGKISDEILYYFEARGIPEDMVNELMAQSKLDAVSGRIPDEVTKEQLLNRD
ncbi:MAG: SufD family Fe-S cluster assembly protein [Pseudobutyrivibrio sp.]|uniref:SufB/SufD family protein n=1 Tax=Pseudobutyrivibrio sp. TaxID=2014367 RepID=UPI0025EFDBDA|nr:SufD family Fe-S cluster assembly protein [Pseudobutyrivibrio sp.]MBQ8490167.1 SufD family Fe-S cluster assembly protein [Pseudobutyrivibrio sp.]